MEIQARRQKGTLGCNSQSVHWFFTYSKCPLRPQQAVNFFLEHFSVDKYFVVQEQHKDGTDHLHCYFAFSRRVQGSGYRFNIHLADDSYHGNYQPVVNLRALLTYMLKTDPLSDQARFAANFDPLAPVEHRAAKSTEKIASLNKRLLSTDLLALVDDGTIALKDYVKYKAAKEQFLRDSAPKKPRAEGFLPNTFGLLLPLRPSTEKRRHFWIWSSLPNKGKTTFLLQLSKLFSSAFYAFSENFQEFNSETQLLLFDEYSKAHLEVTKLNQICDGTYSFPVKGGLQVKLRDPVLVICGNVDPKRVYVDTFPYVEARFNFYELK